MKKLMIMSVTDQTGIEIFKQLTDSGDWDIIASGGTGKALAALGIPHIPVSEYTGFPEILHGKVKTIHPKIEGGILCDPTDKDEAAEMREHGIRPIDVVVVNFYRFVDNPAVRKIDIGGPTLARAAVKNAKRVTVLTDPVYYALTVRQLLNKGTTVSLRNELALNAVRKTKEFDTELVRWAESEFMAGRLPFGK